MIDETGKNRRQIAFWLLLGVGMLVIQILIGGITRLTESGLSITEWKPITGALPPLNDAQWQEEFAKYRNTDQFKYVHGSFTIQDFKFIFFWEWFHRLWARVMGLVFIIGFTYFLLKKKMDKKMVAPMIILFVLGALQGAIGWIMVKSGLVPEKYFVGHVELTTHFVAANILLVYTLWFALTLLPAFNDKIQDTRLHRIVSIMACLLLLQFIYGGLMAGLKAGSTAPTWPLLQGALLPATAFEKASILENLFNNPVMVQFIHRGLAYLIFGFSIFFYVKSAGFSHRKPFGIIRNSFLFLVCLQVILGIITVLSSTDPAKLVWLGSAHQFVAILVMISVIMILFLLRAPAKELSSK